MGIRLKRARFEGFEILEKAGGVGGTWYHNRYPGCACDIPSHLYSFSFELKRDWSRPYAPQPEILAYLEHCAEKYGLLPHCRFGDAVRRARWDEGAAEYGPNTNADSIVTMIEYQVDHVLRQIQRIASEDLAWIDVKPGPMAEYNDEIQRELEAIAMWHTDCSDYYRAPSGRIVTQWPRSMPALEEALSGLDEDAYEVASRSPGWREPRLRDAPGSASYTTAHTRVIEAALVLFAERCACRSCARGVDRVYEAHQRGRRR